MAANTIAITPKSQNVSFAKVITAVTATDGTGAVSLLATAGADGSRVDQIRVIPLGTNATASVLRFFLNNGSDPTVAANNSLIHEVTLPVNTLVQTAASAPIDVTITKNTTESACPIPYLKGGLTPQRIYIAVGTTGAAGWQVSAHLADY